METRDAAHATAFGRLINAGPLTGSPSQVASTVLSAVRTVLPADGGALVLTDPATTLFTAGAVADLPAASCHPFFSVEITTDSPRRFRHLAHAGAGADALSVSAVDDDLYAKVLEPHGYSDEIRVTCTDLGAVWGCLSLWRSRSSACFTAGDAAHLDHLAPLIGATLRDAVVRSLAARMADSVGHGLVVLARAGGVESSGDLAFLSELTDPDSDQYRQLDHLRALAEGTTPFETVLSTPEGHWMSAHGNRLDDSRVAVTLSPATARDLFGALVAGAGLTARETEVTQLICRGLADAEIARELSISRHTAHDHVRAVRRKLGVQSRTEVIARVFTDCYFDGFLARAEVSHHPEP